MKAIVAVALVTVAFSGCSSGAGLQAFLAQPGDAGAGCQYTSMDEEELQELREFGLQSNPGSLNTDDMNEFFGGDGFQVTEAVLSVMDCQGDVEQIFSLAMRFQSANGTTPFDDFAEEAGLEGCDEDGVTIVRGTSIGIVEIDYLERSNGTTERVGQHIMARTGGTGYCGGDL